MEKLKAAVSAGDIAEFCFPEGSLGSMPSVDRMYQGTAAHRKLQNAYSENESIKYRREVPLEGDFENESVILTLQGRADGIFFDKTDWYIHEIKSTYCDAKSISSPLKAAHKAQMMIYASIFASEQGLESIKCRLSYFCLSDDSIVDFDYTFSSSSLREFVKKMTDEYSALILRRHDHYKNLILTSSALDFPFSHFRPCQREGAAQVYSAIKRGKFLFLQAPTGAGKTMMALFPAVKSLAENESRIFCLSAKNQTMKLNETSLNLMREKGLKIKSCTISAKSKCCLQDVQDCSPEKCPYSLDFYKKLHRALGEMLEFDSFTPERIREFALKYELCPYELSLELSLECDVIICDYNYLFDPTVYLRRFFDFDENYIFLVDEAHNLVDRGRDMYSSSVRQKDLREIKKTLSKESKLYKRFSRVLTELNKVLKIETKLKKDDLKGLFNAILSLSDTVMKSTLSGNVPAQTVLYSKDLMRFMALFDYFSPENFCLYCDKNELILQCTDPAVMLESSLKKGSSAVLYSATLSPYEFYKNCILPETESFGYRAEYPFNRDNLTVFADYSVDTRYSVREDFYEKIAGNIKICRENSKGNIFAFFPSYEFMHCVGEYCDFALFQPADSDLETREEFLKNFSESENAVAFGVLGSHFSEGLDIKNLCGIIIVGVGLPKFNRQRENIQHHFEEKFGCGFDYAYVYPGINKVCQASGRLIRSESDRGFIFLMDSRFRRYRRLLPEHWTVKDVKSESDIVRALAPFMHK